ncbi:hypothetical protein [Actinomyces gaoshouyii]|uniref:hypothetical protein n=1 Tax=Actinomyces gaoshouyii TaxID=1960083 RepID=UPI0009C0BDFA|nr:hypothetical protein [Actinomyces gaoshouyii]ARD42469.1 hypothetical protein B6G06_09075 [Actinomyces gaoshouyii]
MLTEPTAHERAKRGLRGRLNRLGLTLPPSAWELAESARLLLAELTALNTHTARLAQQATVIVSRASKDEPDPHDLVERFNTMTRSAVAIPYDPAMASRPLLWNNLAPTTRRAWLTATARAVEPLNTHH